MVLLCRKSTLDILYSLTDKIKRKFKKCTFHVPPGEHLLTLSGSDALGQPPPPMETFLPTWALIYTASHPPRGFPSYCSQALIPHTGLSWLFLYPLGELPCSVPPKDFKTILIRKDRSSKEGRRGRTLYLILLYILYEGLWFC